jgi:hypothetical protein
MKTKTRRVRNAMYRFDLRDLRTRNSLFVFRIGR